MGAGVPMERQSVTGRRPNKMQMAAGCLSLCLASQLAGKWENRENLSEATDCGPRVSRNKIPRAARSMQQAFTEYSHLCSSNATKDQTSWIMLSSQRRSQQLSTSQGALSFMGTAAVVSCFSPMSTAKVCLKAGTSHKY